MDPDREQRTVQVCPVTLVWKIPDVAGEAAAGKQEAVYWRLQQLQWKAVESITV